MNDIAIYAIGFVAQILFTSRTFIQWIISERKGKVVNPTIFWYISLMASIIMIVYGIMRSDAPIILGQLIPYFIYVRNIQLKDKWDNIPSWIRLPILILPITAIAIVFFFYEGVFENIVNNKDISTLLFTIGIIGQILFTMRFVLQWLYSERQKKSVLPPLFWICSILGSSLILTYGVLRKDPVLILGHCTGLIVYIRNLILWYRTDGKL
ncbi:MAG: lipid-A-disaccharide synthase N-terminal domain-containing protein [Bacteroidota bacterium]